LGDDIFSGEIQEPPNAQGKKEKDERDGENLLEGFAFADIIFRDVEGFVGTVGDHAEGKDEGEGGTEQGSFVGPGFEKEEAEASGKSEGNKEREKDREGDQEKRMFLIDVLAASIRRDMDHMNEDGPPNVYGGDAREDGESGGGSDTGGTSIGNGIGHCDETMTTHGREEQKGTDE
jgi:hypothetical protein